MDVRCDAPGVDVTRRGHDVGGDGRQIIYVPMSGAQGAAGAPQPAVPAEVIAPAAEPARAAAPSRPGREPRSGTQENR